jgi:hypothetical protein
MLIMREMFASVGKSPNGAADKQTRRAPLPNEPDARPDGWRRLTCRCKTKPIPSEPSPNEATAQRCQTNPSRRRAPATGYAPLQNKPNSVRALGQRSHRTALPNEPIRLRASAPGYASLQNKANPARAVAERSHRAALPNEPNAPPSACSRIRAVTKQSQSRPSRRRTKPPHSLAKRTQRAAVRLQPATRRYKTKPIVSGRRRTKPSRSVTKRTQHASGGPRLPRICHPDTRR